MPIPNRRHEGKTLYSVGKATIYIDRGVAFVQSQGNWKPVSLQNLMILAKWISPRETPVMSRGVPGCQSFSMKQSLSKWFSFCAEGRGLLRWSHHIEQNMFCFLSLHTAVRWQHYLFLKAENAPYIFWCNSQANNQNQLHATLKFKRLSGLKLGDQYVWESLQLLQSFRHTVLAIHRCHVEFPKPTRVRLSKLNTCLLLVHVVEIFVNENCFL